VRSSRKQKKAGKRTQNRGEIPNRVVSVARPNDQGRIETRSVLTQTFAPATKETLDVNIPSVVEDHELEPWSMGAIARRTSQLEFQLVQAISQAKRDRADMERPAKENVGKGLGHIGEHGRLGTKQWNEETGLRWAQLGGLPTRAKNPGAEIRDMTEEEEEY
jgi:hypothetical protein